MGKQDDSVGAVVVQQAQQKTVLNYDQIEKLARAFVASGMFGRDMDKISKGITKIMAGQELGLAPFASMRAVHVIEGNATLSSNTMAAMVKASPKYDYEIVSKDNMACEIKFIEMRDGDRHDLGIQSFTIEDAQTAGLAHKNNWKNHPEAMIFARCVSNGVRTYCPDVFSGMAVYTPEELEAPVKVEGNRVEAPTADKKVIDAGEGVDAPAPDELPTTQTDGPVEGEVIEEDQTDHSDSVSDPEAGDIELEDDPEDEVPDNVADDTAASIYADAPQEDLAAHVKDQLMVYLPKPQEKMRFLKDLTGQPFEPKKKADLVKVAEALDKLAEEQAEAEKQPELVLEDEPAVDAKEAAANEKKEAPKKTVKK